MNQSGPSRRNKIQYLLFFLVLFVLPAASLYFLNSGKNYRLQALSELENLGRAGEFTAIDQSGKEVNLSTLSKKVVVVAAVPNHSDSLKYYTSRLDIVHKAYDDTPDVLLLMGINADDRIDLAKLSLQLGIEDAEQWRLLHAPTRSLFSQAFQLGNEDKSVALVDTSGMVRNFYNIYDNREMGRLMEHIALIIPKQPRR